MMLSQYEASSGRFNKIKSSLQVASVDMSYDIYEEKLVGPSDLDWIDVISFFFMSSDTTADFACEGI